MFFRCSLTLVRFFFLHYLSSGTRKLLSSIFIFLYTHSSNMCALCQSFCHTHFTTCTLLSRKYVAIIHSDSRYLAGWPIGCMILDIIIEIIKKKKRFFGFRMLGMARWMTMCATQLIMFILHVLISISISISIFLSINWSLFAIVRQQQKLVVLLSVIFLARFFSLAAHAPSTFILFHNFECCSCFSFSLFWFCIWKFVCQTSIIFSKYELFIQKTEKKVIRLIVAATAADDDDIFLDHSFKNGTHSARR